MHGPKHDAGHDITCKQRVGLVTTLQGRGWSANGLGRSCGRVALSATVARRWRDGSRDAGLRPPAGCPRPSGDPSRIKSSARPVGDRRRGW
eukprot:364746-Chlamydomonas_euryale.AAC.6